MAELTDQKRALLVRVARLYYEQDLTQAEIAQRLNISRPQVSRLLAEGRQEGIVKITIQYPTDKFAALRRDLLDHFHLQEVHLLPAGHLGQTQLTEELGVLAARHLETKLADGTTMGISWDIGVYQVVNALQTMRRKDVTVVQLTGAVGSINPRLDGPDLTRWLAQTLGGHYKYFPAPLIVDNATTRQALMEDKSIRACLNLMKTMDVALVGIGSLMPGLSSSLRAKHITEAELRELVRMGGVGDICSYHYDLNGNLLPLSLHERIVGVTPDMLRRTPHVIAVGGGIDKAAAVLGALRLGLISCLVTDEIAGRAVLKMAAKSP